MKYAYRVTRVTPNNNVASEEVLNKLGQQGFRVVASVPFNMEVFLVMEREVKSRGKSEDSEE